MELFLGGPRRCAGCGFPPEHCFCASIPRVDSRVRVLVVRHAAERKKVSNTGGFTARVVGGELVEHGRRGAEPLALRGRLGPSPRLLFPLGSEAVSEVSTLVVLDGTWQQARAMRARLDPLPEVPVLSLPAVARTRMREPHLPEGMSTMEAVAGALELLGEPEPARVLRALYAELTARWLELRQSPLRAGWPGGESPLGPRGAG